MNLDYRVRFSSEPPAIFNYNNGEAVFDSLPPFLDEPCYHFKMEKLPVGENNEPKKSSKFDKTIRSALAGATLLGIVGGAELPKGIELPHVKSAEAHEVFSAEREAKAFLDEVAQEDEGLGDAQAKNMMHARIETKFNNFALAYSHRASFYSAEAGEKAALSGSVDRNMIETAKKFLLPRILARSREHNPGLEMLQKILTAQQTLTPQQKKGPQDFWKEMGN